MYASYHIIMSKYFGLIIFMHTSWLSQALMLIKMSVADLIGNKHDNQMIVLVDD